MKNYFIYIFSSLLVVLSSCQDDDFERSNAPTYPASGDWYVNYTVETSPGVYEDIYGLGHSHLIISNTASMNPDSVWVSDEANFWVFKVKAGFNKAGNTIAANEATSVAIYDGEPYPVKVNITNGKILVDQGKTPSGVKTDSIYFEVAFDDDVDEEGNPYATKYIVSGHRFSGFDEH